jgi:hypothetical protein
MVNSFKSSISRRNKQRSLQRFDTCFRIAFKCILKSTDMRKIIIVVFIFTIIFSCEKSTDFCESGECQKYFKIWKDIFISRNQLSESYFNDHVFPYRTDIDSWNDGKSFRVEYKIKIDWAEANLSDQFIIWIDPSTTGLYPSIPTPRSTYLSKDQIAKLFDIFAFNSSIHKVAEIDHLLYSSRKDAIQVLETSSGVGGLGSGEVYYQNPSFNEDLGHPLLRVTATINRNENKCLSCNIDLVTGENEVRNQPCAIYFCFVKGTKISISDGRFIPIEKLKITDEVFSLNIDKWTIEKDIIQKMDSVIHSNIIQITFTDSTINSNTSDHPYFVKDKGWCSYKPVETFTKYNINAKQLQVGDICLKEVENKLIEVIIKAIIETPGEVMTYNLSKLSKNKNYFANGILVSTEQD